MINNYLEKQIKGIFQYNPTSDQEKAIGLLSVFLLSRTNDSVFILKGYAGTGKTSLVASLVKTMALTGQKSVLLAPTGRAAKVFSLYAGHPAFTIHKKIYRQKSFSNEPGNFSLNDNLSANTLFIVDEASMIANEGLSGGMFGTGRLLDDLVRFVYSGNGCRLLLVGDTAQLPPVGERESPALNTAQLEGYGLEVTETELKEVVRQSGNSGILWNATRLRRQINKTGLLQFPKVKIKNFPDLCRIQGSELVEAIADCYDRSGMEESIVICRSNKRAYEYNKGIRNLILYREEELESGDLLMVAKNNYFWAEGYKEIEFIANGDIAVVKKVRRTRELYGFRFAEVILAFPDYDDCEMEANLVLDTLSSDTPALSKEQNDRLFYAVLEDYADITVKRERMKKMKSDPYFNALQVKYAYAVTCHKAQGGQWKNVFLDQGLVREENLTVEYLRWLYTAFTRATGMLYLVNYPKEQVEE